MGQITHSTERTSSFLILLFCVKCLDLLVHIWFSLFHTKLTACLGRLSTKWHVTSNRTLSLNQFIAVGPSTFFCALSILHHVVLYLINYVCCPTMYAVSFVEC